MAETRTAVRKATKKAAPAKKAPVKKAAPRSPQSEGARQEGCGRQEGRRCQEGARASCRRRASEKKAVVKKASPASKTAAKKAASRSTNGASRGASQLADRSPKPHRPRQPSRAPYADLEPKPTTTRFSRRTMAIAGIVAVALVVSAAGAFIATRDYAPSKAKYLLTADEVCRPANGPVTAIVKPTSYPELATAAGTVVTTMNGQFTQLNDVEAPGRRRRQGAGPRVRRAERQQRRRHSAPGRGNEEGRRRRHRRHQAGDRAVRRRHRQDQGVRLHRLRCRPPARYRRRRRRRDRRHQDRLHCQGRQHLPGRSRKLDDIRMPAETPQDIARFLGDGLAILNQLIADMKAIPVPPGDEATVSEMLDAADKSNAKLAEARDAAAAADFARFTAIDKEISPLDTAANAKFDAYGLTVCGSNLGE